MNKLSSFCGVSLGLRRWFFGCCWGAVLASGLGDGGLGLERATRLLVVLCLSVGFRQVCLGGL